MYGNSFHFFLLYITMKDSNIVKYFSKKDFKSVYLCKTSGLNFLFQAKDNFIVVKKIDIQKIILKKIESSLLTIDDIFGNISEFNFYKDTRRKIIKYINMEIDILSDISLHENFISYISHELLENLFILRMEYCPDMSVADFIINNSYNGDFIQTFIKDMKNALDFMKEKHIIHRDLKLNNILYKDGVFKITDFELACYDIFHKDVPKTNETFIKKYYKICGTLRYIAPEIITSIGKDVKWKHFYSYSSDIWSIGCCLYQLVYFQNLFPDIHSIIEIKTLFQTQLIAYINKKLENDTQIDKILSNMLIIDSNKRFIDVNIKLDYKFLTKKFQTSFINSWEIIESASIENLNKEFNQWLQDNK